MRVVAPRLLTTELSRYGLWPCTTLLSQSVPLIRSMYCIGARASRGSGDDQTMQLVPDPRRSTTITDERLSVCGNWASARAALQLLPDWINQKVIVCWPR